MAKSTITSKHQTTVPKLVRERLGVGPGDVLRWEVLPGYVRLTVADRAFLKRRGTIGVGAGSVVHDIAEARSRRGAGSR